MHVICPCLEVHASDYGWPAVAGAAVVYVLLRSEIRIYYPGRNRKG
jgi:hypothetical protein